MSPGERNRERAQRKKERRKKNKKGSNDNTVIEDLEDLDYNDWDDDDDDCVTLLVKDEKYETFFHLALQNAHRIKHTNQGEVKLIKERK